MKVYRKLYLDMSGIFVKQERLIALQVLFFAVISSIVMIVMSLTYVQTSIFENTIIEKKVNKIEDNKMFEDMYKGYKDLEPTKNNK